MTDHGWLRDILDYDPESGSFNWRAGAQSKYKYRNSVPGFWDKDGYRIINLRGRNYRAGRLAWWFVHGEWPSGEIDHINRLRWDDRISNLRDVSVKENRANRGPTKLRKGYPSGISLKTDAPRKKPWAVTMKVDGKQKTIGHYATMEEAANALVEAKQ